MPRCLDNPVGLSEFTIDSHTIGKLLAELIGPDVVIYWGREDEEREEFRGGRDPDTLERRSSRGSGRSGSGHSPARPDLLPSGSPVCADSNHVRTWSVTRFRGMISTQPGSTPLASFKILALESADGHGGCSAGWVLVLG